MEFSKRVLENTVSGLGSRIMGLVRSPITDKEIKSEVPELIKQSKNDLKRILNTVTQISDEERKSLMKSFKSQVDKLYGDWNDRPTLLTILSSIVGGAIAVLGWVYGFGAPVLFKLVGGCIFAFLAPTFATGTLVFAAGAMVGYGLACWYFSGEDEAKVAKLKALDNAGEKFNNLSFVAPTIGSASEKKKSETDINFNITNDADNSNTILGSVNHESETESVTDSRKKTELSDYLPA